MSTIKQRQNENLFYVFWLMSIICNEFVNSKQILREGTVFGNEFHLRIIRNHEKVAERMDVSFPGTKWCGPGNTATDFDDLGEHQMVDECCRAHDHCDNIGPGQSKYNLTNQDYFTRLDCKCDKDFYNCLQNIDSNISTMIGIMYFMLRDICYKEDYPIIECLEYDSFFFVKRCSLYLFDESMPKTYQWFDLPFYYSKTSSYDNSIYTNDYLTKSLIPN